MVDKAPKISIIVPCFNCKSSIKVLLDQLLKSSPFEQWECICVDNSPNNETFDFLKQYEAKDPRIIVKKSERIASPAAARNVGLTLQRGDFVWIVDSDDEFMFSQKWTLGDLVGLLQRTNADISFIPCKRYVNGSPISSYLDNLATNKYVGKTIDFNVLNTYKDVLKVMYMPPWTKIYKGEFLRNNESLKFQDIAFCNDNVFSLASYNLCNSVSFLNCPLVYRQNKHADSVSSMKNKLAHVDDVVSLIQGVLSINYRNDSLKHDILTTRINSFEKLLRHITMAANRQAPLLMKRISPQLTKAFEPYKDYISSNHGTICGVIGYTEQNKRSNNETPVVKEPVIPAKNDNAKHDAVYVLGDGSKNYDLEILYSITSMRKFCPFIDRIFIIGCKPRSNVDKFNVTVIPCRDPFPQNKDANMMYKVLHAITSVPDLSDDFLVCSDDQLVTQPCTWEDFKPKYISEYDPSQYPRCFNGGNNWIFRRWRTLKLAYERRGVAWMYEPHIWSPFNKEAFKQMLQSIGGFQNAGIIKSQYYNTIENLDHEKVHDHMFVNKARAEWDELFANPPKFLSYNDNAFNDNRFRYAIALLLKDK